MTEFRGRNSQRPVASFANTFDPRIWHRNCNAQGRVAEENINVEYRNPRFNKRPTGVGAEIKHFLEVLKTVTVQPEDLNAFLVEHLGKHARELVARNWNVISGIIYAPVYRANYGTADISNIRKTNIIKAVPGAVGGAPIFQHLLDNRIQPDDLQRVDTAFGQQIVKHRRFMVHSVHGQEMCVTIETGFGDKQRPPADQDLMRQYSYSCQVGSGERDTTLPIPKIYWKGSKPTTKDSYFHTGRCVWLHITTPVSWEGRIETGSMKAFADAVGTVGPATPSIVTAEHDLRIAENR